MTRQADSIGSSISFDCTKINRANTRRKTNENSTMGCTGFDLISRGGNRTNTKTVFLNSDIPTRSKRSNGIRRIESNESVLKQNAWISTHMKA